MVYEISVSFFAMCIIAWKRQYNAALIKKKEADSVTKKASVQMKKLDQNPQDQVFSGKYNLPLKVQW